MPLWVWHVARAIAIAVALAFTVELVRGSDDALRIFWGAVIPTLPAVFLVAPGLWRNVCPLAASNQTPRYLEVHARVDAAAQLLPDRPAARDGTLHRGRGVPGAAVQRLGRRDRRAARRSAARRPRGRHAVQGQERLVLEPVPVAAGAARLRPDAVRDRAELALPSVRGLHAQLLRLQPARRLPRRPLRGRPSLERPAQAVHGSPARRGVRLLPAPRAQHDRHRRVLRPLRAGGGRERRELLRARDARAGHGEHAHRAVRRDRDRRLLLLRGPDLRGHHRRLGARRGGVGAAGGRARARAGLAGSAPGRRSGRSSSRPGRRRARSRRPRRRRWASAARACWTRSSRSASRRPRSASTPAARPPWPGAARRCWRWPRARVRRSRRAAASGYAARTRFACSRGWTTCRRSAAEEKATLERLGLGTGYANGVLRASPGPGPGLARGTDSHGGAGGRRRARPRASMRPFAAWW